MFTREPVGRLSPYLSDESKMAGEADNVIRPYDESEVREVLRFANAHGIPVTVSAMRTGVCGGAVPEGGDVLSLERMRGAVGLGRDDRGYFLRVLPCTTVAEIDDLLSGGDLSKLKDVTPGAVGSFMSEGVRHFYPVDPTEAGGSIGGNISTNASGPRTFRYGSTRDWVRRVRVVLPDGGVVDAKRGDCTAIGRRLSFPSGWNYYSLELPHYTFNQNVKNAAGPMSEDGMDLVDLFVGSEGIFGVVTEADVYLAPWRPLISNIAFFPTDRDALDAVPEIKGDDVLEAEFAEYMDGRSLDLIRRSMEDDPAMVRCPPLPESAGAALFMDVPADGDVRARYSRLRSILEGHGSSLDMCWCGHEDGDRKRMRELRHSIPKAVFEHVASMKGRMPRIHKMGTDMSVPEDRSEEMTAFYRQRLDAEGLDYVVFGHAADSHLHVEIILRSEEDFDRAQSVYREFAAKAVELGGSPSAEHGIGKIKTYCIGMMYGQEGIDGILRVKSMLDPKMLLNRGNIVEAPR